MSAKTSLLSEGSEANYNSNSPLSQNTGTENYSICIKQVVRRTGCDTRGGKNLPEVFDKEKKMAKKVIKMAEKGYEFHEIKEAVVKKYKQKNKTQSGASNILKTLKKNDYKYEQWKK